MKTCVIFNPSARGEKAARFRDHLAALSAECVLKPTFAAGSGRALSAEAVQDGCDVIVAAGGDGTVNEVLNGIGDAPDGFARTRLAVMPLGTVNVFARELRMPPDFQRAWAAIKQAREAVIDLPQVEFTQRGATERRFFATIAGAGWDSKAVELVNWEYKKRIGALAYVWSGLQALTKPLPQIAVSDGARTLTGELVIIGNGQLYGGNYRLFPLADLRDGVLEVSVFPKLDIERILRGTWGLFTNRLYETGAVQHLKAERLTLSSAEPQVPFHVEGENVGCLPAEFSVRQQALRVIVP
ncbi:MAG: diacylglycerol kinase family lipid kinase [Verrucomicrobia subdivision 3 bacterium]|nr:diacylglycerol kinase family lipid kinase [Limisphaerales bacterium]